MLFVISNLRLLFVSVPVNVHASPRSTWFPWPRCTARVTHNCGIAVFLWVGRK
jgi:hypothetical protein